jgi:hypothetical protein
MKKYIFPIIMIIFVLAACDLFDPETNGNQITYFTLTDTLGNPGTTFHTGESFYVEFCLTNTTEDSLDFTMYDSGPFVRFSIYQDDQYIAGSMDGLGFNLPVIDYKFAPGDSMTGAWLAPTTPWQDPLISLSPGDYRAIVDFPQFDALQTDTIGAINFTVVE